MRDEAKELGLGVRLGVGGALGPIVSYAEPGRSVPLSVFSSCPGLGGWPLTHQWLLVEFGPVGGPRGTLRAGGK